MSMSASYNLKITIDFVFGFHVNGEIKVKSIGFLTADIFWADNARSYSDVNYIHLLVLHDDDVRLN